MGSMKLLLLCLVLVGMLQPILPNANDVDSQKAELIAAMRAAGVHVDDLRLMQDNLNQLSIEQLIEIQRFMTDSATIAAPHWFDVSSYTGWDQYNFYRPVGDTILTILARRDLFLDAALELNNRALTNMSPAALAALAFSQVYVEEKWDHEVPWDGDPNPIFNWVHPDVLASANLTKFINGSFLDQERVTYWWATYFSLPLSAAAHLGLGRGDDMDAALQAMRPPNANAPRLAGYSYPVGNQLYVQTTETVYWYADYRKLGPKRYGSFEVLPLDTKIQFPSGSAEVTENPTQATQLIDILRLQSTPEFAQYPGLWAFYQAPFAAELRVELSRPETAAFWNVMRFVYAGARQREGGASPEHPENGQPAIMALQYDQRTATPVGRNAADISAFALMTTVYSDSILLDFTNWDSAGQTLIHVPDDASRSDGIDRQVSERNKAILVVEQLGSESAFPNATHISGTRGLGLNLVTQYEDAQSGDFLPYSPEEAAALVHALTTEARDYGIEASRLTLCHSPLLRAGYEIDVAQARTDHTTMADWTDVTGNLCS